jgi:hypothetical protein
VAREGVVTLRQKEGVPSTPFDASDQPKKLNSSTAQHHQRNDSRREQYVHARIGYLKNVHGNRAGSDRHRYQCGNDHNTSRHVLIPWFSGMREAGMHTTKHKRAVK